MPYLDVGDGHQIYYEKHGNGKPIVVLHGGPGGGLQRSVLRLFDLARWQVILFDQRGCGRSTPFLSLHRNTTWDLVADIERLRKHLEIDTWSVFGGSWGTTLALAYASRHPAVIKSMVLRGVCLLDEWETRWLYEEGGASRLFPEEWATFAAGSKSKSRNKTRAYHRLLSNRKTRKAAAAAWWGWESAISQLIPTRDRTPDRDASAIAVIENHYFSHNAWLKPGQLLKAARRMTMPVHIVQGRYDLVCPPAAAVALARALPNAQITMVTDAGHSVAEKGISAALRRVLRSST